MKSSLQRVKIYLRGGLGNQLFQYATALALADSIGAKLLIDISLLPKKVDQFRGLNRWPEQISEFAHSGEIVPSTGQPSQRTSILSKITTAQATARLLIYRRFFIQNNWIFDENIERFFLRNNLGKTRTLKMYGYFQRYDLFSQLAARLASEITSLKSPSKEFKALASSYQESGLAIHVRLGDKLSLGMNSIKKYEKSLAAITREMNIDDFEKVTIFSDSPDLAVPMLKALGLGMEKLWVAPSCLTPLETLLLLSKNQYLIGSESSFFWWATFLQQQRIPGAVSRLLDASDSQDKSY